MINLSVSLIIAFLKKDLSFVTNLKENPNPKHLLCKLELKTKTNIL